MQGTPATDYALRPRHWIALFGSWQLSLLAVAGCVWWLLHDARAPVVPAPPAAVPGLPGRDVEAETARLVDVETALAALRDDNTQLHTRVARLQRDHAALSREYLKLGFRNALDQAVGFPKPARRGELRNRWLGGEGLEVPVRRDANAAPVVERRNRSLARGLEHFDRDGLHELLDRALRVGVSQPGDRVSLASATVPRRGGVGAENIAGLVQLRELEPLLELLLALQSQGGAGGGFGGFGGGEVMQVLQGLGEEEGRTLRLTQRDRRLLPALLLLAFVRDAEEIDPGL